MATNRTREDHLRWCRDRAIQEFDFYKTPAEKQRNGLMSLMMDLGKNTETAHSGFQVLCLAQMRVPMDRQQFITFIDGFT